MKEEDSPKSLSFDRKKNQLKIRKTKQIIKQTNKQTRKKKWKNGIFRSKWFTEEVTWSRNC